MKQNKDGQASHHSQIFNFESILAATSNFSTENKLGEHKGFFKKKIIITIYY